MFKRAALALGILTGCGASPTFQAPETPAPISRAAEASQPPKKPLTAEETCRLIARTMSNVGPWQGNCDADKPDASIGQLMRELGAPDDVVESFNKMIQDALEAKRKLQEMPPEKPKPLDI